MSERIQIGLAQVGSCVGGIEENEAKLYALHKQAAANQDQLLVMPEMFLPGYPCEDLVYHQAFLDAQNDALDRLAKLTLTPPAILVGGFRKDENGTLYNSVFLLESGQVKAIRDKVTLPNYGVFDEQRTFKRGALQGPILFKDVRIGFAICEDIWDSEVGACLAESGAELVIVSNASPFDITKDEHRIQQVLNRVIETELPFIYLNYVGGQDELVFDGGSFAIFPEHKADTPHQILPKLQWQAPWFEQALWSLELTKSPKDHWHLASVDQKPPALCAPLSEIEKLHAAVTLGLRDYCDKNGFAGVLIGLSGGVDSSLSAAIAVDALGADRVRVIFMPSRFTSQESHEDAHETARLLGLSLEEMPIEPMVEALHQGFSALVPQGLSGIAAENLQSRLRGMILMTLSNHSGYMVLTTGNKSEMAVGYATLYGDMCGGFNVLKDLTKQQVFELSRWYNERSKTPVMPERVITKPPSAELRDNQKDTDSLPDYAILDAILTPIIEQNTPFDALSATGMDEKLINKTTHLMNVSEYKRRQAAPGVKCSARAFGRDWRYPITNHFRQR